MIKFDRNYRLTIASRPDPVTGQYAGTYYNETVIEYPITIQFSVQRENSSSLNTLNCVIYNLSEETRSHIFQDRFGYFGPYRHDVTLEAGYGDNLTVIFKGPMFEAGSTRNGSNILTIITARDGGQDVQSTSSFLTLAAGTSVEALMRKLIGDFPTLNQGAVTETGGTLKRPVTLDGNTYELLKTYSDQNVFVDLGLVHVLNNNEYIELTGELLTINADTGLLETPRRNDSSLSVITLFEPSVTIGQLIQLESTVQKNYNGTYKVISIYHNGIISGSVNGDLTTTLGLLLDGGIFGKFTPLSIPNNSNAR